MEDFIFSYKKFFIFITVLLLSITFMTKPNKLSEVSAASTKYTVNTADLNVRTEPSTDSEILTVLDKGVVVAVTGTTGSWSKITLPSASNSSSLDVEDAYVKTKYLTKGTSLKTTTTVKKVSVSTSKGTQVINYAKKFVGNPYRWGGESLTKGADCSGFIKAVYKHFGKSLPHSSYSLRSVGTKVSSLSKAKAGDIICYNGHVALYMGNNKIVHASNVKTGIKISYNASYRKIVAIRRIFN
jgi:cell wall-associated NlpC family hydrolase